MQNKRKYVFVTRRKTIFSKKKKTREALKKWFQNAQKRPVYLKELLVAVTVASGFVIPVKAGSTYIAKGSSVVERAQNME